MTQQPIPTPYDREATYYGVGSDQGMAQAVYREGYAAAAERCVELVKALEDILGDRQRDIFLTEDDNDTYMCVGCGREYDRDTNLCESDDCPRFKARAVLRKVKENV